ncbi:uncharacterized protein LOC121413512 isoform X1 [Lytechinus variegatus]|uniref:uncharacterized protein LOC121413512 isoform X1 n=1 Tax=Lytechinus variegatus TaxID=7654 RepID=UPI001BB13EBA|nr:uncharacterized protein LOC121413512 isoform X1 [Lytechinus variegatus]
MSPEKENVNNDGYSEEVQKKLEIKRHALAVLFGGSSVPLLPVLDEERSSKSTSGAKNGRTTSGHSQTRQGNSTKTLSNFMPEIKESHSVAAKNKNSSLHRQPSQERISRTRSSSETMTTSEEEETLRAFTKSRRAVRRRTSASRGSRGADGLRDDEAPPMRPLLRRRSTRFSWSEQDSGDVSGSSTSLFGRRGSMSTRMSDWRRISLLIKQEEELKEIQKKKEARKKFIRAAKLVIVLYRVYKVIFKTKKDSERIEPHTFTSLAEEYQSDNMKLSGLSFDRNYFKVKKEVGITQEVKHILSSPSYFRTKEQLGVALIGLQTMKSFAEYPLHMQEKLVKVAWYEFIPPKRVIIRQGHYAENFYFVICGSVVVTILSNNPDTGESSLRTVAVLRRGSSFGEIAILHHGRRTATVSSQGPVHLLAITREDFFDIFMRGQEPGQEPEHVKFLRQINFMKYWPIEILKQHPEMCLFHFYKRGQVIVKDSEKSEWIYVVKSGTCQVLMQLKAVKPNLHTGRDSFEDERQSRLQSTSTTDNEVNSRLRSKTLSLPDIEPLKVSSPKRVMLGQHTKAVTLQHMDIRSLSDTPTFLTRSKTLSESEEDEMDNLPSHTITHMTNHVTNHMTASLPNIDMRKGATPSQQSFSPSTFRDFSSLSSAKSKRSSSKREKKRKSVSPSIPSINVSADPVRRRRASIPTDRKGISVFIQVELLHPKDCFGLSSLDFDFGFDYKQSSVSLVSRGAECIMVKKDFFMKHAPNAVKRNVRSLVYPYPTAEKLQENLQSHTNWSTYKTETMTGILNDQSKMKDLKA